MGINPNSSGHGILWGALFFMPYSLLSFILLGGLEKELEAGLRKYREEVMPWKKRDMVLPVSKGNYYPCCWNWETGINFPFIWIVLWHHLC